MQYELRTVLNEPDFRPGSLSDFLFDIPEGWEFAGLTNRITGVQPWVWIMRPIPDGQALPEAEPR